MNLDGDLDFPDEDQLDLSGGKDSIFTGEVSQRTIRGQNPNQRKTLAIATNYASIKRKKIVLLLILWFS